MPAVPEDLSKFDSNIYVRIFKFIGPICMTIIISGIGFKLNKIYFYINIFISISYILYKLYYIYRQIKHWIYNVRNGNLLVRNSPLDFIGTIGKVGGYTIKSVVNLSVGTGLTYALCHELDDILEKEGKEAYFVPKMKTGLERSGISDAAKIFLDKLGIKDTIPDKSSVNNSLLDQLNKLNNIDADKFKNDTGVSIEDAKKTIEYLNKNSNSDPPAVTLTKDSKSFI
jgi:hypothetical protein